jgi:hypothetical protein
VQTDSNLRVLCVQSAEVFEFQSMQKELEKICKPIITSLYQGGGNAPRGGFRGTRNAGAKSKGRNSRTD